RAWRIRRVRGRRADRRTPAVAGCPGAGGARDARWRHVHRVPPRPGRRPRLQRPRRGQPVRARLPLRRAGQGRHLPARAVGGGRFSGHWPRPGPVLVRQDRRPPRPGRRRAPGARHVARARGHPRIHVPPLRNPPPGEDPRRLLLHRTGTRPPMLIAFFVNTMEDEYENYTTTLLAHEASRRGHDVCYITPEDFVFGVDDRMRAHARFVPNGKQPRRRSRGKFFKDIQSVAEQTTLVEITDIDVLMLRNDPSDDASERPWAADVGIQFGRRAAREGVLVLNDPGGLTEASNKLYFQ